MRIWRQARPSGDREDRLARKPLPLSWGRRLTVAISGVVSLLVGLSLLLDRPGLLGEYHALDPHFVEGPTFTEVGVPALDSSEALESRLVSKEIFGIRWSGWVEVKETSSYRFGLRSAGEASLSLTGKVLLSTSNLPGRRQRRVDQRLEAGLHPIEVDYAHFGGPVRLQLLWGRSSEAMQPIAAPAMFVSRPGWPRRALRGMTAGVGRFWIRIWAALLTILGIVLSVRAAMDRPPERWRVFRALSGRTGWLLDQRWFQWAGIALLGVAAGYWAYRYTGATVDGDDVRYLYAAAFAKKMGWIINRYAHVYLLRAFMWLEEGEVFSGSRLYWATMFGITVGAMAIAVRSIGPRLQIRTLIISLILLLSQTSMFSGIGAAYADFTAMMFITLAVAVYLHGLQNGKERDWGWHAFFIGALTVAAIKSKETGLILMWLPILFLWRQRCVDRGRFVRSIGWWFGGGLAAYLVLMIVDWFVLGDFWFSVRPETLSGLLRLHGASEGKSKWDAMVWLEVVWSGSPRLAPIVFSLRHLGVLVLISATVALAQRRHIEVYLLHLIPVVYLGLMMAIHPAFFSTRFLIPIIPVACLLAGFSFAYLGLEEVSWTQMLRPSRVVPITLALVALLYVVMPLRLDPNLVGEPFGSLVGQLLVGLSIVGLLGGVASFIWLSGENRVAVMLICLVGYFGPGLLITRDGLDHRLAAQRGELILYPWIAFHDEIDRLRPRRITIAQSIVRRYRMSGQRLTRKRLARMFFRRVHLDVVETTAIGPDLECVIGDVADTRRWEDSLDGITHGMVADRTGQFRLIEMDSARAEGE